MIDDDRAPLRSTRARELQHYLRLTIWPHGIGLVSLVAMAAWFGSETILFFAAVLLVNGALSVWAYVEVRRGRLNMAVALYTGGLLIVVLALFSLGVALYAVATAMVLLPAMMAMPYLSERGVLIASMAATAAILAGIVLTTLWPGFTPDIPPAAMRWMASTAAVVVVGIAALTLWYNARMLGLAVDRARQVGDALRDSERTLRARSSSAPPSWSPPTPNSAARATRRWRPTSTRRSSWPRCRTSCARR